MNPARTIPRLLWLVQAGLLGLEVFLRYDTAVRQAALAVSNIGGVLILLLVARRVRRWGQRLPSAVAWFVAVAIWFDAAGNFAHLYARFAWWDQVAHAVGSAAVAAALFLTLRAALVQRGSALSTGHLTLYAVSLTTLLTVVYEITEYIGDLVFATNRIPSLYDTADDLVWNLIAISLSVLVTRRFARLIDPPQGNQ